jgi:hypothetical protein
VSLEFSDRKKTFDLYSEISTTEIITL